MASWLMAWTFATVLGIAASLTINRFICDIKIVRLSIWLFVLCASVVTTIGLMAENWQLFAVMGLLETYKIVAISRVLKWRLQRRRLQNATFAAMLWLSLLQLLLSGIVWLVLHHIDLEMFLFGVVTVQVLVGLALLRVTFQTWNRTRPKELEHYLSDSELPTLSVLVPARNETDELRSCLESLIASDYPKLEIIVLDDCSVTKRTPEIIHDFAHDGVRFVAGNAPEEKWLPKNYAYQRLSEEASGEILLFCGTDINFDTASLRTLISNFVAGKRSMVSVMPQRVVEDKSRFSVLQPMRYFWELCWPRRFFKRPPVLSSCWLVTRELLDDSGGFEAVAHSITPEAHFARQAVISNSYSFLRSNRYMPIFSAKTQEAQYQTTLRVRYPQLHRRIELVAVVALFEFAAFIAPFLGVVYSAAIGNVYLALGFAMAATPVVLLYTIVSVKTGLCKPVYGVASTPIAFILDILVLHVSCLQYEFGSVTWKGRNVCYPVMQVIPKLPKL